MKHARPEPNPFRGTTVRRTREARRTGRPRGACRLVAVWAFAVIGAVGLPAPAARAEPEPLPTQEELHQLYDQQKYPQVLQKLARVMVLKGVPAKAFDHHDLLRLKGETQLRLKATAAAEQAFNEAAKEAPDPNAAALDLATEILIHRAQGGQYMPKPREKGKPPPPGSRSWAPTNGSWRCRPCSATS